MPAFPTRMAAILKAAIGCGLATVLVACGHSTPRASQQETPKPGTTPSSLIVSVDDVRHLSGVNTLTPAPGSDNHQPRHHSSQLPTPCQTVFDQQAAFDGTWKQFDSATYSADLYKQIGPDKVRKIADVSQAIATFPDDTSARSALTRVITDLKACQPLHVRNYDYTIDAIDPTMVKLHTDTWAVIYQVQSSVLFNVAVLGIDQPDITAGGIASAISDRIR